jgi:hypothetical protein
MNVYEKSFRSGIIGSFKNRQEARKAHQERLCKTLHVPICLTIYKYILQHWVYVRCSLEASAAAGSIPKVEDRNLEQETLRGSTVLEYGYSKICCHSVTYGYQQIYTVPNPREKRPINSKQDDLYNLT